MEASGAGGLIPWLWNKAGSAKSAASMMANASKFLNSLNIFRTMTVQRKISAEFRNLTTFQNKFDAEMLDFLAKWMNSSKTRRRTAKPDPRGLQDAYADYMSQICNTAVKVISYMKPQNYQFNCNIKIVQEAQPGDNEIRYTFLACSTPCSISRLEDYTGLLHNPLPIKKHRIYSYLVDTKNPKTYHIENDFDRLSGEMKSSTQTAHSEPSERNSEFYRSFLTVLIKGQHTIYRNDMEKRVKLSHITRMMLSASSALIQTGKICSIVKQIWI